MSEVTHMTRRLLCLVLSVVACTGSAAQGVRGADPRAQQIETGRRVYLAWCEDCHGHGPGRYGTGLTGTAALEAKYDGRLPAVLDERKDLTPDIVRAFVRKGVSVMPFFRKTEITDPELDALGAYLSRLNPSVTKRR